jgi:riboflavin synthase
MFSGIIEAQSQIKKQVEANQSVRIVIDRPAAFDDIKVGDSICTNGVCLTIENFDQETIQFCLGAETIKLLGHALNSWKHFPLNLERSLKLGDRVHGHLVTGHVDTAAKIVKTFQDGECWQIQIEIPKNLKSYFWKKGSICLNGVSLTVNEVTLIEEGCLVDVCLIPETMKKTNLSQYGSGDHLNLEADYLAKAYLKQREDLLA